MPLSSENQKGLMSAFYFAAGQIFSLYADSDTKDAVEKVLSELTHDEYDSSVFDHPIKEQIELIKLYLSQGSMSPIDRIDVLTIAQLELIKKLLDTARKSDLIDEEHIRAYEAEAFKPTSRQL